MLATAGSGKTAVLTERVKALIQESSEDDVLALTFTTEAAEEMERRIGFKVSKLSRAGFRTFHSLGLRIIMKEANALPFGLSNEPFPDGQMLSRMVSEAMKKSGIPKAEFKQVRGYISSQKRQRITPEKALDDAGGPFSDERYANAYSIYEKNLRDGGMLDYDSMICESVSLLENNANVRDRWQFKWLLADEAQDTDNLQFRMLQLMSEKHKNCFVVGDVNQALYAFRGAHPENLLNFEKWFPGSKTIILPENYRSTPEIVEYCRKNAPIKDDLMSAMRTANPKGVQIEFKEYRTSIEETVSAIASAAFAPGKYAILARTNRQLADFETFCLENKVRFRLLGKSGFWKTPEVQNLANLVTFAISGRPASKYSEELVAPHRNRIRQMKPEDGVRHVIKCASLEGLYASEDYKAEDNYCLENLRKASQIAGRFETLSAFVNHARKALHASKKVPNALTLSTVHQAKGLEFDNVFVVGVQEGMLPHKNGEPEEEKRIFYVAISRPKHKLTISFVGQPSQYISPDLPKDMQVSQVVPIQAQTELF